MKKNLAFALLGILCILLGLLAVRLLAHPSASGPKGFVVIRKVQAVAPQYQPAPVRVACPADKSVDKRLCGEASSLVSAGGSVASTRMRCMPGSAAFEVSGEMSGKRFSARFDCNRTNREGLRRAAESAFSAQAVTRSYK